MVLPTGATAGPTKAATDKVTSGLRASALEAARAAAIATHAAAGLALGVNRQAARALRAAEACSRSAVALLSAPSAPSPTARLPEDAAEEPPRRRRRRRGKRGGKKRPADEGPACAGHGLLAEALALRPAELAALPGPAAEAAAPMVGVEEEGAARRGRRRGACGTSQAAAEREVEAAEEKVDEAKFRAAIALLVQDPVLAAGRPPEVVTADAIARALGELGLSV